MTGGHHVPKRTPRHPLRAKAARRGPGHPCPRPLGPRRSATESRTLLLFVEVGARYFDQLVVDAEEQKHRRELGKENAAVLAARGLHRRRDPEGSQGAPKEDVRRDELGLVLDRLGDLALFGLVRLGVECGWFHVGFSSLCRIGASPDHLCLRLVDVELLLPLLPLVLARWPVPDMAPPRRLRVPPPFFIVVVPPSSFAFMFMSSMSRSSSRVPGSLSRANISNSPLYSGPPSRFFR